jgi:hypothetical protein
MPKRVRFESLAHAVACQLYPQKRTLVGRVGMSALCQKRTSAWPLVVRAKQRRRQR